MASVRPPPTEEETHKKNMKHFVQLQRSLESNEEQSYLRAAQALTQWLNNGKAYYTAAKPEVTPPLFLTFSFVDALPRPIIADFTVLAGTIGSCYSTSIHDIHCPS